MPPFNYLRTPVEGEGKPVEGGATDRTLRHVAPWHYDLERTDQAEVQFIVGDIAQSDQRGTQCG